MNGRKWFTNLAAVAAVTSLVFLASCDEDQPTDPTAFATGATAAAKGGNGNGGGKGGGGGGGGSSSPADPVLTFNGALGLDLGVVVMNRDGSNQTLVAELPGGGTWPAWAPGGSGTIADPFRISYSNPPNVLTIIDVALVGGTPQVVDLVSHPFPDDPQCCGVWSPLGDEIAFQHIQLNAILIMQVADGSWRTVYQGPPNHTVRTPAWSPDGQFLVFREKDVNDPAGPRLMVLNLTDSTTVGIDLGNDVENPWLPDWARTRDAIAFGGNPVKGKKSSHVYVVELEPDGNGNFRSAGPPVQLRRGGGPSWSPDDSEIVFRDGKFKIYTFATASTLNLAADGGGADWRR